MTEEKRQDPTQADAPGAEPRPDQIERSRPGSRAADATEPAAEQPDAGWDALIRGERRYSVANQRGRARGRIRYIESTHPPKGCRFF